MVAFLLPFQMNTIARCTPVYRLREPNAATDARLEVRAYRSGYVQLMSAGTERRDRYGLFHFPMSPEFAMELGKTLIAAAQVQGVNP